MIIIDDITRPTPCEHIAKAVIAELVEDGVPRENIWFIAALGLHGCMYREHFVKKLEEDIVREFEIHSHNAFFNRVFVDNTSNNTPIEINADFMSADYKIGIGTIMGHRFYGLSGGAKCILSGVASTRNIVINHSHTSPAEFNMDNTETFVGTTPFRPQD